MPQRGINEQTPTMLGKFPNTHTFSKRMAEELLLRANTSKLPLVFIRPSIMGSSANEPLPGWTDSVSLLQGVALLIGLGVMRDIPGNSSYMADIVPVDIVARQMLTALAYVDHNRLPLFISNSTSSSMNPTTWGMIFSSMVTYQNQFPYEKRAGAAALTMHSSESSYLASYKLKNQLPTNVSYYLSRFLGSKARA